MNKFVFFLGSIIFFTTSLQSMKITREQAQKVRNYIYKKLSYQKKLSSLMLLDEHGKSTVQVPVYEINQIIKIVQKLFIEQSIKDIFITASLYGFCLQKSLIPFAQELALCDENGRLNDSVAAVIRSFFVPQIPPQITTENDDFYVLM